MPQLTAEGQRLIDALAQRYGVSAGAVMTLLQALVEAQGRMAQFSHPEFGGSGQWMRGGMTMVGDMFNNALQAKVDGLCSELSDRLAREPLVAGLRRGQSQAQFAGSTGGYSETSLFFPGAPSHRWWPEELGTPASVGSQNDVRYAFFPAARRLAIEVDGRLTLYDTLDHLINGVSQQQSQGASLTFISQHGLVRMAELPRVGAESHRGQETSVPPRGDVRCASPSSAAEPRLVREALQSEDIFVKIERLAELKQKGILSEAEFAEKKAELLARL